MVAVIIVFSFIRFVKLLWNKVFGNAEEDNQEENSEPNTEIN